MFKAKKSKMFRLLALSLILSLFMASTGVYAEEKDSEKIEISFLVGDSTLKINGKDVTVETPYVKDGTTLVPLRVISEAFGSKVSWEEVSQGITLEYDDVTIKLNINKKTAYINSQAQEMLQAPELKNSTTMVPLRFVTENFGADVSFDDKTSRIIVVKVNTISDDSIKDFSTLLTRTTKEYIGDSYYGWSMKLPKEMRLINRSFDGYTSLFSSDDKNKAINVYFLPARKDDTIDIVGAVLMKNAKDKTLIDNGKKTDSDGKEYYYIKYKDKKFTYEAKIYIKGEIVYNVLSVLDNNIPNNEKQAVIDIMSSFRLEFSNDVEDLSDITDDGYRVFQDKLVNLSLDVPADWMQSKDENKDNEFRFFNNKDGISLGNIYVGVYSTVEGETIEQWANKDRVHNIEAHNPKCITATDIKSIEVNGKIGYYYEMSIKNNSLGTVTRDIFLSNGNYRYNISVKLDQGISKTYMDRIVNSFEINKINEENVGKLIRFENSNIASAKYTNKNIGFSADIPVSWTIQDEKSDSVGFYDKDNGISLFIMSQSNTNKLNLTNLVENFTSNMKDKDELTEINGGYVNLSGNKMYQVKYSKKGESETIIYYYIYATDNKIFTIGFSVSYLRDGELTKKSIEKVLNSLNLNVN